MDYTNFKEEFFASAIKETLKNFFQYDDEILNQEK